MKSLRTRLSELEGRIFAWKADYDFRRFVLAVKAGSIPSSQETSWGAGRAVVG